LQSDRMGSIPTVSTK